MTHDVAAALEGALAAVPFLPRGKGALILILGGLAMLAFCLLLARLSSGPPPSLHAPATRLHGMGPQAQARIARRPKRPLATVAGAMWAATPGTDWVAGLERAAGRRRLGQGRIVSADSDRCVFFLADCASCRKRRRGADGCERERRAIERALTRLAPRARALELSCDPSGQGACTFEVRRRGYV